MSKDKNPDWSKVNWNRRSYDRLKAMEPKLREKLGQVVKPMQHRVVEFTQALDELAPQIEAMTFEDYMEAFKSKEPDGYVRVGGVVYPTIIDEQGTQRFIENPVIRYILDEQVTVGGKPLLNAIGIAYHRGLFGRGPEAQRAYAEFNMALGYSVCGFEELSSFQDMEVERLSDTEALAVAGEEG